MKKEKKKFIVIVLIVFVTYYMYSNSSIRGEEFSKSYTVEYSEHESVFNLDDLDMIVTLPAELHDNEEILKIESVSKNAQAITSKPDWVTESFVFDISLGDVHELPGVAELKIAYDKSKVPQNQDDELYLSAMYFNETTQEWEYVRYDVDEKKSEIVIKTDHFSIFGIFFGDSHDDFEEVNLPTLEKEEVVAFNEYTSMIVAWKDIEGIINNTEIENGLSMQEDAIKALNFVVESTSMESLKTGLKNYGSTVFLVNFALAVSDDRELDAMKSLITQTSDFLIDRFGNTAMKTASVATFAIDYSLDKFVKKAFEGHALKWERVFEVYYDKVEYKGKTALGWRNFILEIIDANPYDEYFGSEPYQDFINNEISTAINNHLSLIWNDVENTSVIAGELGENTLGIPSDELKKEIIANYKKTLYTSRIVPAMTSIQRIMDQRAQLEREKELQSLVSDLNRVRTIFIKVDGNNFIGSYKLVSNNGKVLAEGQSAKDGVTFNKYNYIINQEKQYQIQIDYQGETYSQSLGADFVNRVYQDLNFLVNGDTNPVEPIAGDYTRDELLSEYNILELINGYDQEYVKNITQAMNTVSTYLVKANESGGEYNESGLRFRTFVETDIEIGDHTYARLDSAEWDIGGIKGQIKYSDTGEIVYIFVRNEENYSEYNMWFYKNVFDGYDAVFIDDNGDRIRYHRDYESLGDGFYIKSEEVSMNDEIVHRITYKVNDEGELQVVDFIFEGEKVIDN